VDEAASKCNIPAGILDQTGVLAFGAHRMTIGTKLFTMAFGKQIGSDSLGNRYFRERRRPASRRERRWVLFHGRAEASSVPPQWHAWLHHTSDETPDENATARAPWQKDHLPNQTGTPAAYRPPGHVLKGGKRASATGDYEPWEPS
jgi:NADH:ubiquinone oxidoreductase subunit